MVRSLTASPLEYERVCRVRRIPASTRQLFVSWGECYALRPMPLVDLIVQPSVDADVSVAVDRYLMRAVSRRTRNAVLRIYAVTGDVVSLGRYNLAPA